MKAGNTKVKNVAKGSIAEEAGIEPGDIILKVNGQKVKDVFDYRYLITEERLVVLIKKKDGDEWELDLEKDQYEDLGLDFESPMMDEASCCTNKCVFCFIDQLPEGMRKTLYFKDDDSRLSFLTGNYVTLTNINEKEIDRIIAYRMSPINVSVHTTNPELRRKMLNNRFAGDILRQIKKLVKGGISVNCQIVLCRDINDKMELDRTLADLTELYPGVGSISVVPVGITRHREGLYPLEPYDSCSAREVVEQVAKWQEKLLAANESRIVYLADEFYILSAIDIPGYETYEDFPQIENGVGLISCFKEEFYCYLQELEKDGVKASATGCQRSVSIATGVSPYTHIKKMCNDLAEVVGSSLKINVYEIRNRFFGENVTVTGLLTGQDLVEQLRGSKLGDELLISRSMLRAGEETFLDDYTVKGVSQELGTKITVVENDGKEFIRKILEIEDKG